MDPTGVFIVFVHYYFFYNLQYTQIQIYTVEADDVGNFCCRAGRDSILGPCSILGFSSYLCCCRFGCRLLSSIALGQLHLHRYLLTLMRWLTRSGVTFGSAKVNSLYACVPSPGLELAPAPLTLVKHHTHRKVACLYPHAQTRGGRCARPATCVCQHH